MSVTAPDARSRPDYRTANVACGPERQATLDEASPSPSSLVSDNAPAGSWRDRALTWLAPALVLAGFLFAWEAYVRLASVPHYILPAPSLIAVTLVEDWPILGPALGVTLTITALALFVAVLGGVALAVLFTQARWASLAFYPFAVVAQVTPIVAIAPLIFIYVDSRLAGLLVCAWLVAFFPILSSTTLGLRSADHHLRDLFAIYGASRWQRLRLLLVPSALPYFLGGLRIAGGLALIGAVVAEYVAGTGGIGSGLAFRILEAGYRLDIPRMFAALVLIALAGVTIYATLGLISHLALRRWHESAVGRD